MQPDRKLWNQKQQALRQSLSRPGDHTQAIELFLEQHAMVHAAEMTHSDWITFADEIWHDLSDHEARRIPVGAEHTIAWLTWHIARIEDVTMNLLVAGSSQLLHQGHWLEQMKISVQDTGNAWDLIGVAALSTTIDIAALRAYRLAVGRRTREIVLQLRPQDLKQKVSPARLQRVQTEGAVLPAAAELLAYWGNLTIAGLLLMPPTRHNFIHLNEASRLKQKKR